MQIIGLSITQSTNFNKHEGKKSTCKRNAVPTHHIINDTDRQQDKTLNRAMHRDKIEHKLPDQNKDNNVQPRARKIM